MKLNVAVFFGGKSCEHEISCLSANQVMQALDENKYTVLPVYIAKNGDFYTGEELKDLANYYDLDQLTSRLEKIGFIKDGNRTLIRGLKSSLFKKEERTIDVAFPVMHGTNGEDGTLQGMLEMLNVPYTSSDVLGSALGQDKAMMKNIFKAEGIPMVEYFTVYGYDFQSKISEYRDRAAAIGYPLIAKPANLGSSIGIEVIKNEEEFGAKIRKTLEYDAKVVVEKMITDLKEVNISVMGSAEDARVSAIEEVYKNDELLSFRDKYQGGGKGSKGAKGPSKGSKGMASTSRKVPAELSAEQQRGIEETAIKTFRILNAGGCVRIDFMIDRKNEQFYVNEINSIPGSLAFYLWEASGIDFSKECDQLINLALKRFAAKEKMTRTFDTNILANYRRK